MKAIQIKKYGGVDVLELNTDIEQPSPARDQILVEVRAAGLNPFDWKIREGYLKEMMPLKFPVTVGGDFAGVIRVVGEEVAHFKVGDEVYGSANVFSGGTGSFAEFAVARASHAALKPSNTNFAEAAALPLVGSSAVQALEEHIKLAKGQKILIHGGGGGIGHVALQLAKHIGAHVATTVSAHDRHFAENSGADEIIDYKTEKFEEHLKDFDAVFDTVGGDTDDRSFLILKKGGIIVSMLGPPRKEFAEKYNVTAIGQNTNVHTAHLNRLRDLVEKGVITIHVDKDFPLEEARAAFHHLEKEHPQGKVVVEIKTSEA